MSELLAAGLPWWVWMLIVVGTTAIVGVMSALFLPDWPQPELQAGFEAAPGSDLFVNSAAGVLDLPLHRGGEASILQNGDQFYPAMLEAIRGARDTVNFQVYIFESDEIGLQFIDAFIERARAGVEVRLLVDWFGSIRLKKRYREQMKRAGVRVERFRPLKLRNLPRIYRRTHRRAIVIDGKIAFTGGAAVSAKWKGNVRNHHEWRDNMTRVTGQLVTGIQAAFATNWVYCTGEVLAGPRFNPTTGPAPGLCGISVVSSPSDAMQPIRLLAWMTFINARSKLWICNSYFIPDIMIRRAVADRARAGVDVRILVPGDQTDAIPVQAAGRSYYGELLSAGVRIFEFQPSMMHAKVVVVDDAWTLVGSANMDERSMELNEENILGISGEEFAREVSAAIEQDFARSKEITLEEWRRRPLRRRAFEMVAKALIEQY